MRTADLVKTYIANSEYRQLSDRSIGAQLWALDKLSAEFEQLPDDPETIQSFIAAQDLGPQSRYGLWQRLATFWRWLERTERSPNVMDKVSAPRSRSQLPRTLSRSQMETLLAIAESRRDKALVALPLDTGIRLGELASLTWTSVPDVGLRVSGKVGERTVPISSHVRELMSGLGNDHHVWVGRKGPLTQSGVQIAIRRLLYRAGIWPPKAGPHVLRHTFGLHYILRGGDPFSLKEIMGHRNIQSTMVYVYMSNQHLSEQHARYSPLADFDFRT